jgi:hypothetical protein
VLRLAILLLGQSFLGRTTRDLPGEQGMNPRTNIRFGIAGIMIMLVVAAVAVSSVALNADRGEAHIVAGEYSLQLDAPASAALNTPFTIEANVEHSGVTTSSACLSGGTPIDPPPHGCYMSVQWGFNYDPAIIEIDIANTFPNPSGSESACVVQSDDDNGIAVVGCLVLSPNSPLVISGTAWDISAECVGTGVTGLNLRTDAGGEFEAFVGHANAASLPTHFHDDLIACNTTAPTNTPVPPTNTPSPTATNTTAPMPTSTPCAPGGCPTPTPCAPFCPVKESAAVWCTFLAAAIDGDASPFDFTLSSDYVQACNGLDTFDIRNLASALGDEDDQLEPSDLAGVDLDANQITDMNAAGTVPSNPNNVNGAFFATLDEIYVFSFVDDDGVVTFDSDVGLTVHVNADNGGYSIDADANTETCVGVDDLDCDDSTPNTDDGDGVVVATLIDATGDAGDDVDVHVEQEGEVRTEVIEIVGPSDEIEVIAFENVIEVSGGPADVDDCVDESNALDFDQAEDVNRTFVAATAVDSDGVALTRVLVSFSSSDDEIAQVGDSTGVSIDDGGTGPAAFAVICGGASPGIATIEAMDAAENATVQITVVGPPDEIGVVAAPQAILCDGVAASTLTATVRDAGGALVADGTLVEFFVYAVGITSPIRALTVDGVATTQFRGVSASTVGVPVYVYAGDVVTSVLITCQGFDTDGDGMANTFEATTSCLNPNVADSHLDQDGDDLTSLNEHVARNTNPCDGDTDDDTCGDGQEVGLTPFFGGDRDPLFAWDFYDVTGDSAIDLADAIAIVGKFGLAPGDAGYDAALDRIAPDGTKPWRTALATGPTAAIDLFDVILNLQSFGHHCT